MNQALSKLKSIINLTLGVPLTIVSFFFIFKLIFENRQKVEIYFNNFSLLPFIIGFVFFVLFSFLRSFAWTKILNKLSYEPSLNESLYIFFSSEIKRYIPGNILSFIARAQGYKRLGIPRKIVLKGIVIEIGLMLITSFILSIPSFGVIFGMLREVTQTNYTSRIILIFGLFFVLGIFLFVLRRFFNDKTSLFEYRNIFLIYLLCWIFFGLGNFFIAASFIYLDLNLFIVFISLFIASWLIGYLSIITPMGLGVRELVLSISLSAFIPLSVASSIAVVLRLILILSELIFLSLSYLIVRSKTVGKSFNLLVLNPRPLILAVSIASYITYFSYVSFQKYVNYFSGRFDLGNMDQTVWNTINGRFFTLTNPDNTNIISRLSIHADYILVILSPLYFLWQDPRMLLLVQSVILGMGVLFVYLISKEVLKNGNFSLVFSISYLLNPFLQRQNLYDFHGVTLATTFLLAAFYFVLKNKYIPFVLFLILSVLTKENIYVISGIFGLYLFLARKKKLGIILSVISITLFFLFIAKFIPEARGGDHFALSYFQEFGESPTQIIKNIIFKPAHTLSYLLKIDNINYLKNLFLPVGFLSLFSPLYLVFSLPDILINLLSNNRNMISVDFHYAASILPFVYVSAIYGVKKIISFKNKFLSVKFILIYLLFSSLFSSWLLGVLPGSKNPSLEVFTKKLEYSQDIDNYIDKIPANVSVSATNNLGAHLSHRSKIYTIPNGIGEADVLLFLLNDESALPSLKDQVKLVEELGQSENYVLVYKKGLFIVFESVGMIKKQTAPIFLRYNHRENIKTMRGRHQANIFENPHIF